MKTFKTLSLMDTCSYLFAALAMFIFAANSISAQSQHVSLKIKTLQAIATSEERGDEIYLLISERREGKLNDYILPNNENNIWHFKANNKMVDIPVWQGSLADNESVDITISIMEKDFAILDFDDELQTFQVTLTQQDGNIERQWQVDTNTVCGPYYEMTTEGGLATFKWQNRLSTYLVKFLIEK